MGHISRAALALLLFAGSCDCGGEPIEAVVVALNVAPEQLDFGHLPVGARITAVVAVVNVGNGPWAPTTPPRVEGEAFALLTECALPLGPQAFCELTVAFAPLVEGAAEGRVLLEGPEGEALTVPLSGTGDPAQVLLEPAALDFGSVAVGAGARRSLTVTNLSAAALTLPLVLEGPGFVVGGAATTTLSVEAGAALEVPLDFLPSRGGPFAALARVEICGAGCGPEVALTGVGLAPRIEAEPRAVDFGEVAAGASATAALELGNAGSGMLVITGVEVLGSAHVAVTTGALPLQIGEGQGAGITLSWSPPAPLGELGATLRVQSNDPVSPEVQIPLDGRAPGPALQLVPAALHFGVLDAGQTQEVDVVVRSAGTVPVLVQRFLVDGAAFSLAPPAPAATTLAAGASLVFRLRASASSADASAGGAEGLLTVQGEGVADAQMPLAFLSGTVGCQPRAAPANADLGALPIGRGSQGSVAVRNVGDGTCTLLDAAPVAGLAFSSDFSFSAARASTIPPGGTGYVDFGYTSSEPGFHSAFIELSFDATAATLLVSASARGVVGGLVGDPPLLELGPVVEGCAAAPRSAGFLNDGGAAVSVDSLRLEPSTAPFDLALPALPITVAPGALLSVPVSPRATAAGTWEADLIAHTSEDVQAAVRLRLQVEAGGSPVTERFVVAGQTAVDVLFVVDNSGSMMDDQEILANNFDAFIEAAAEDPNLDVHLGVTTTDVLGGTGGPLVGPFLRDSSGGLASAFGDQVRVGVGGSGLELGLEAMRRALDDFAHTTNAGFLRPDAALSVIIVSDEEDSGDIPEVAALDASAARPPESYVEFLRGLKAGSLTNAEVLFSVVGIPLWAPRYQQVTLALGGVFLDIAAPDWGTQLSTIGSATFGLQRLFRLGSVPAAGSVVVTIDGVATTDFSVLPGSQSVLLDEPPPEGAVVEITYQAGC